MSSGGDSLRIPNDKEEEVMTKATDAVNKSRESSKRYSRGVEEGARKQGGDGKGTCCVSNETTGQQEQKQCYLAIHRGVGKVTVQCPITQGWGI